jgi:hypothetical protein
VTLLSGPVVITGIAVTGLVLALLLSVGAAHVARRRREQRDAVRQAALVPLVYALLDGEEADADLADAPAVLDEVVLHLLPQLRGSDRKVLQDVLVARGVVERAAADLTARAAWRRGRAAMLLGYTASTAHTAGLITLLADRSSQVRCAAARALGKAGDVAAAPHLLAALTAERRLPSGIVGMALLDLGTAALPALREALTSGTAPARALAASLLGLHGDLQGTPTLTLTLADGGQPVDVRRAAAEALGRISSPRATDPLCHALAFSAEPVLRHAAAEALGRIGDPAAAPALVAGMAADDPGIRAACADALGALGPDGRSWLTQLADGEGPAAGTARGALDALAVRSPRLQTVAG